MHFHENAQKGFTIKSYIKIMSYTRKTIPARRVHFCNIIYNDGQEETDRCS